MSFLTRNARRVLSLAQYLEQPRLWCLRRRGIPKELYHKLTVPWLRALDVATILDIGANTGQFAFAAHMAMPQARIFAFEPLADCFAALERNMAGVPGFKAFNVGLGAQSGGQTFECNDFSASSSFLKMAETHKTAFPHTAQTRAVTVRIERLDDFAAANRIEWTPPMLVKIDVQGYEDRVLDGGERTIRRAKVLVVETSFETLYEGQPLFPEICSRLVSWGFRYAGAMEQMEHPQDKRFLQADSIFVR